MYCSANSGLNDRQLTGRDEGHLLGLVDGLCLQQDAADAFIALQADAARAGFELKIASGFRSFERQLAIWNDKAAGRRAVHDDRGRAVEIGDLEPEQQLHAILRYTALPGASRHHWGTDIDVYDAAALAEGGVVELVPEEVGAGGVFDPLHCWLDKQMASDQSRGFFRPYYRDTGGVAVERWHLSFAPLARLCEKQIGPYLLRRSWEDIPQGQSLALAEQVHGLLDELCQRYVFTGDDWCSTSASGL